MKISEMMNPALFVSPTTSIKQVVLEMEANACGFFPVVDRDEVVGVVTGRDIAVRATALGLDGETPVGVVMSAPATAISSDADAHHATLLMKDKCCHRLPVINSKGHICGVVSLADLAGRMPHEYLADALTKHARNARSDSQGHHVRLPGLYLG